MNEELIKWIESLNTQTGGIIDVLNSLNTRTDEIQKDTIALLKSLTAVQLAVSDIERTLNPPPGDKLQKLPKFTARDMKSVFDKQEADAEHNRSREFDPHAGSR